MTKADTAFTGNIPNLYQKHLVPLLFGPWAELLANRAATFSPRRVLETAAGTGVLTSALVRSCPGADIVATDLNSAMLEVARSGLPGDAPVRLLPADACALPFGDATFDLACSQFGIMFYPDRVKSYSEAVRVLRPRATLIAAVWGSLDDNPVSQAAQRSMEVAFPDDPPRFLARTPFSYHDAETILDEAKRGGFASVAVERIVLPHPPLPADDAVRGLVYGSPLRAEIEERGPGALKRAAEAVASGLCGLLDREGRIDASMTALIIIARR